jgi:hypothetical protein
MREQLRGANMSWISSAGVTSFVKILTLNTIGNPDFTGSTVQLVLLGAAEGAISIMACSIPILRALLRDSNRLGLPPPGEEDPPTYFYMAPRSLLSWRSLRSLRITSFLSVITRRNGGASDIDKTLDLDIESADIPIEGHQRWKFDPYIGDAGSRGTGRTSTIIESLKELEKNGIAPPGRILQTEEVVVEYEDGSQTEEAAARSDWWIGGGGENGQPQQQPAPRGNTQREKRRSSWMSIGRAI